MSIFQNIVAWALARLQEPSTYIGLASLAASIGLKIALPADALASNAAMLAGIIGAGLVAATTKNVAPLVQVVEVDLPVVASDVASALANSAPVANAVSSPKV